MVGLCGSTVVKVVPLYSVDYSLHRFLIIVLCLLGSEVVVIGSCLNILQRLAKKYRSFLSSYFLFWRFQIITSIWNLPRDQLISALVLLMIRQRLVANFEAVIQCSWFSLGLIPSHSLCNFFSIGCG